MDTVFFHQDRFELLIDARGFQPEDIKCRITPNLVEILAQRQECCDKASRSMALTRNYQLPQCVKPQEGNCCYSSEGILLVPKKI
ncbi:hypothetical protein JTB14_018859 [Gonioctena quinquepunctata]|nr:hypothetical protein JTB14_018859 [Gonioctena quinquepunctata]